MYTSRTLVPSRICITLCLRPCCSHPRSTRFTIHVSSKHVEWLSFVSACTCKFGKMKEIFSYLHKRLFTVRHTHTYRHTDMVFVLHVYVGLAQTRLKYAHTAQLTNHLCPAVTWGAPHSCLSTDMPRVEQSPPLSLSDEGLEDNNILNSRVQPSKLTILYYLFITWSAVLLSLGMSTVCSWILKLSFSYCYGSLPNC